MERCKDDNVSLSSLKSGGPATSLADAAARARAQAEAAIARAAFADKEMRLKIEQAETEAKLHMEKAKLDAELEALHLQREAAAAIAKAEILEAAIDFNGGGPSISVGKPLLETDDTERTSNYVNTHSKLHHLAMDTARQRSPPNKKRKLEKIRKPLSFALPQAGLKELQVKAAAIVGSVRNPVDSVAALVEKTLTDLRVLYKRVPCRNQEHSLFVTAVENTWIHGRQKRREQKRQLRELPRAPHCAATSSQSAVATAAVATNPPSQNQPSPTQNTQDDDAQDKTAEESNGAFLNETSVEVKHDTSEELKDEEITGENMDMQSSTCAEAAVCEPLSKRPLSPSAVEHFLFKCLLNVLLEENDVVVEMHWVEGQNKDLMNQLCTYLKNTLLKTVAKS